MSSKLKFRLNHICHRKGCEGSIGEVIEVSQQDADWLLERKGGELLGDDVKPAAKKKGRTAEGGHPTKNDEDSGNGDTAPAGGGDK